MMSIEPRNQGDEAESFVCPCSNSHRLDIASGLDSWDVRLLTWHAWFAQSVPQHLESALDPWKHRTRLGVN